MRTDPIRERAPLHPDRIALIEHRTGRQLTWTELDGEGDRLAGILRGEGVDGGDRVATLLGNTVEHVALLLAASRIGAALVPLNWRLSPAELAPILADADPARIVTDAGQRILCDPAADAASMADRVVDLSRAPSVQPPAAPDRTIDPEDPVLVLYTSGSTGRPKGAILPHRQLRANAEATTRAWGLDEHDVVPITTPLFHTGGWNVLATPVWHVGGAVVLIDGFEPEGFLGALDETGCTVALVVPTQLFMLAQADGWGRRPRRFDRFVSGGAPCPPALASAVRTAGYRLQEGYGLTECGPNCFAQTPEESAAHPGWVGRPVPGLDVRLRAPDGTAVEGPGQGELLLRGPQVFHGYLGDPDRTAAAFDDGWLRTGDIAERSADGRYRICGRLKEMFISGGENVYPAEVEAVLLDHPAVAEAVVTAVADEKWGEVGRAWIVVREGAALTPTDVRRFARARLAAYKVPKTVVFRDALPRLGSGKIDRRGLERGGSGDQAGH